MAFKSPECMGDLVQGFEVVGRQHLTLNDREVDFDLIEPTAVNRSMDQLKAGIPLLESLNTGRPSMGGTIVDNPEHSARLGIRRLAHHPVDQAVKSNNAARSEEHTSELQSP